MNNHLARLVPFLRFVQQRFREDRCVQFAASLTYTTLLALVPIITIALTVLSAFPVFTELTTQLKLFILSNFVPTSAGKIITIYMQQFSEKATRLTVIGVALLAVTAFMLMLTIDHAFNMIWRVKRQRPWLRRFLIYWAALTLGPLMIGASLSLTSYLVSLSLGLAKGIPLISEVTLKLVPVMLTLAAFSLLYLIVPGRPSSVRHAVIGGVAAGLVFELMKKVFTLYITQFPTYTLVYGTFASVPIFLIWIYLSWLVILAGAELAAALPYWHSTTLFSERIHGQGFFRALAILKALYRAQQNGEILNLPGLQQSAALGPAEVEEVVEQLSTLGWVGRLDGGGWVLTRSAETIRLADAYRAFVFDPAKAGSLAAGNESAVPLLTGLDTSLNQVLALNLREFSRA
jgi:membrane protein